MKFRVSCYSIDGKKTDREGEISSKNQANYTHFQTSTTKIFGHYLFVGSKKYDVIGMDSGYRWMVIGHPSLKAGWIFSKTRDLPKKDLIRIRDVLERTGYDSCDFFTFPQRNMEMKQPLCQLLGKTPLY
jgi:apolipoprotein D and lipocalin family protein